jgi:hypothetical protein
MNFPFETDPRFAALPYSDQQQIRLKYASKLFAKDQRFLNLPENDKLLILQKVMTLPPVFENPEVGQQFAQASKNPVLFQTFANANKQSSLIGVVMGMMSKISPEAAVQKEVLHGRDAEKGAAWIQNIIDSSESLGPIAKMLPKLGSIVGFVADLTSYATATHLIPTRAAEGLLMQAADRAVMNLAKIGASGAKLQMARWALADLAPFAARAVAQGATGVLRDNFIMPLLDGRNPDTSIVDIAKTFGTYAAGDTLFWGMVGWGFPFLKLAGRVVKTTFTGARKIESGIFRTSKAGKKIALNADEMRTYEAAIIRGDLPSVLYDTLSPAVQDHLTAVRDRQFFAASSEIAASDPFGKTTLAAGSIGLDVVQDKAGGYRVRHVTDPGTVTNVKTLGQLDESLVRYLRERKGLFNLDELRVDPLRGHLVRMMDAQDHIDDSLKAIRGADVKPSFVSLDNRPSMSPIEAEGAKAGTFVGMGQNSVADTFHIPLSEASLEKMRTRKLRVNEGQESYVREAEESLFPRGADAVPLGKEGGTPNVFAIAGKVAPPEEFTAAQAWAKQALKAGSKETEPNLVATALRRAGYDGANMPDGSFFALYPERQIKILDNTLNPATGKKGFKAPASIKEENVSVSIAGLKGTIADAVVGKDNRLLGALLATPGGKLNPENTARASSLLLKRLGAKDSRVAVTVLKDATEITLRKTPQGLRVFLPPKIEKFASTLAKKLAGHVSEEGKVARIAKQAETVVTLPKDALKLKNLKTWFANLIEQDPRMKVWAAKNAQGLDPIEAIKKMALSEMTPQLLKTAMAKFGVKVIGAEGSLKAVKGGKIIASGRSAAELLANAGIELKRVPSKYMPKVVALSPDGVVFEAAGIGVKGGPKEIWSLLDNFDDIAKSAAAKKIKKIFTSGEGSVAWIAPSHYEVSMPAYGIRKSFSNLEEARTFVKSEWKSWSNLSEKIEGSGGVLRQENGKYVVHLAGTRYEAQTLPELGKIMRDLPDPQALPELVGEDVALYFKEGAPLLDFIAFRPRYVDQPPAVENPNFLAKISMSIKPMGAWITDYGRKIGAIEVMKTYNDMQTGIMVAMRDTDIMLEVVDNIQRSLGVTGRKGLEKANGLFYLLGETDNTKRASIIEKFNLGDKDIAAEVRLRAIMGKGPNDPNGLFAKFGIDPDKFIYGYMSRVRAATDQSSILHLNHPEATERILEKAFGKGSIPKEIAFWAENMRTSDVISFALDTNVFSVMRRYITRGNLRRYAGESWRNMVDLLEKPGADKIMQWRVYRYMDMLQGGGFTDGEKLMQSFLQALMQKLGFSADKIAGVAHHDVMRSIYSLSYTAHLGWRPYVAIRNMMQMYQTVGPLVGNSYLKKAVTFISSKKGEAYIAELRRRGIVHQAPPIVNQLVEGESILGKLSNSALGSFKYADDITRAVGYYAGQLRFEDGLKAFGKVDINNARRFAEFVGTNQYGPEMNSRILETLIGGNSDAAKHVFANALQERSLFLMRRELSPIMFHGVVGKMFGQYGTFAANYVQFVSQTWKNSTKAQKAAFAARWIGNSAALAGSMYAIGLQGKDWLPWAPAQFTGGPLFNTAIDVLHSMGSDYQARAARGELNRMLPIDLNKLFKGEGLELQPPVGMLGYYQIRSLMKISEYMDAGDPLRAFYALISAPIRSE